MSSRLIGQVPTEKNSLNPKSTECQYVPAPISYSIIVLTPQRRVFSSYDSVGVVVGVGVKQPYLQIQKCILFWCHFTVCRPPLYQEIWAKLASAQIWAKWAQNGPNLGFSGIFLTLNHQISLILYIMIDSNDIQQEMVVICTQK